MKLTVHRFLLLAAQIGTIVLLLCTLLTNWGEDPYWMGLFPHFRFQYALGALICTLLFIAYIRWRWFVLAALVLATNLTEILPIYRSAPAVAAYGPHIDVVSCNVLRSNLDFDRLINHVTEQAPDIIFLTETTYAWIEALKTSPLSDTYHFHHYVPRYGYFGLALLSKFPLSEIRIRHWSEARIPSLSCRVHPPRGAFRLYGLHPSAPPDPDEIRWRNEIISGLVKDIERQKEPIVLLGDLNLTPYHPRFKALLRQTGLKDSRQGFGRQGSFPSGYAYFGLTLDHVLLSPAIKVLAREVGPRIGSDHRPISISLQLP